MLVGAVVLLALAFLIVLGPRIYPAAARFAPGLALLANSPALARYGIATFAIVAALVVAHKWLTAGRRPIAEIMPGILATVVLWVVFGAVFGKYLAEFASAYVFYYAGLASVVTALVFLYLVGVDLRVRRRTQFGDQAARASADPSTTRVRDDQRASTSFFVSCGRLDVGWPGPVRQ